MLDYLDHAGAAFLTVARSSSDAARVALSRWRELTAADPDANSIEQHLAAVVAECNGDFELARDAYMHSQLGLHRRAATVNADAERGIARCWLALGDRVEARRWATAAVHRLRAWPGPDLDESVRLLRSVGGRPPRASRESLLSDRELEVAVLVSKGMTNVDIGTALYISPRTVSVHVGHILDKLGAASRAEIAAYAVRQKIAG